MPNGLTKKTQKFSDFFFNLHIYYTKNFYINQISGFSGNLYLLYHIFFILIRFMKFDTIIIKNFPLFVKLWRIYTEYGKIHQ